MIKIFLTIKNRLSITKKCIQAIVNHTTLPYKLYIYDNSPTCMIKEHFEMAMSLYKNNIISQYIFNTDDSTYNAFSKVSAFNMFGKYHQLDPLKNKYDFLLCLDNDIIVLPNYDIILKKLWEEINNCYELKNSIKIINQLPGGISKEKLYNSKLNGLNVYTGYNGGSGFWSIKSDFFDNVGFLDIKNFISKYKGHDILYWKLLNNSSNGKPYVLGITEKIRIHCGGMIGSTCNILRKDNLNKSEKEKMIEFKDNETYINTLSFEEFMNIIIDDPKLNKW